MKAILGSIFGIFAFTALITHIWTVIIAFTETGLIGCILTLLLPFLSELYWMFKMVGIHDTYAYIALIHLIFSILYFIIGRK